MSSDGLRYSSACLWRYQGEERLGVCCTVNIPPKVPTYACLCGASRLSLYKWLGWVGWSARDSDKVLVVVSTSHLTWTSFLSVTAKPSPSVQRLPYGTRALGKRRAEQSRAEKRREAERRGEKQGEEMRREQKRSGCSSPRASATHHTCATCFFHTDATRQ